MSSRKSPPVSHRRGSVIVEFSLLVPLLVSLFLGAVFFGYDFYTYNRLEEAVRMGARFASVQYYDTGADPPEPPPCTPPSGGSCKVDLASFVRKNGTDAFAMSVAKYTVKGDPNAGTSTPPKIENLATNNVRVSVYYVDNGLTGPLQRTQCKSLPAWVEVAVVNYPMVTPFGRLTINKPVSIFPYVHPLCQKP